MKKTALVALVAALYGGGVGAATTTVLNGGYIPEAYAAGCDPTTEPDDGQTRVEPRHCTEVRLANPVLASTVKDTVDLTAPMTLTLTSPSGIVKTVPLKNAPRVVLPAAYTLTEEGLYTWHITYRNRNSTVPVNTGERTFLFRPSNVDPGLAIPTATTVRNAVVNRAHPRILPRAADGSVMTGSAFNSLMQDADIKKWYDALLADADEWMRSDGKWAVHYAVTEPADKDAAGGASWGQMAGITRLSMAGYATGDSRYANEAVRRLLLLAAWSTDKENSTSGEKKNDQANRNAYYTLAFGLDVYDKVLTPAQKYTLIKALNARLEAVPVSTLAHQPYDPHLLTAVLMRAEAIMLATGSEGKSDSGEVVRFEDTNPGQRLEDAWNDVVTTLGTWGGGADSAYGNGVYYGWMSLDSYGRALANYLIMSGQNLTTHPALNKFHNNFLAFTSREPRTWLMSPFGDMTEDGSVYRWNGHTYYRLYALVSGKQVDEWYYRKSLTAVDTVALPVQHFFLRATKKPANLVEQTPSNDYLFEDAGTVAMHSDWRNATRSSLYFRSSRLGSYNHSHADNNAFTFVSKGRDIFVSGGWYVNYFDDLHKNFTRPTRFKNALTYCYDVTSSNPYTCAGMGQSEPDVTATTPGVPSARTLETPGKLVNYLVGPDNGWSVVTGDATKAYSGMSGTSWQPMVENAVRSIAYNRAAGIVVIYDWARSAQPRHWQQNFQTLVPPTQYGTGERRLSIQPVQRTERGAVVTDQNGRPVPNGAPVCLRYHGYDGKFHTQAMTDITPLAKAVVPEKFPEQYHTTYTPTTKSAQNVSITVIAENCADVDNVPVTFVQGPEMRVDFGGTSLTFDRDTVKVTQ